MLISKMNYGYNDVTIIPSPTSQIEHRNECVPYKNGYLPIFAAPMSTVVNEQNCSLFYMNNIIPIIPRNIPLVIRLKYMYNNWTAFSLNEVRQIMATTPKMESMAYILIDVANGHMKQVINLGKELREQYGDNILLMGGNIASASAYKEYCQAGFDFVRVGIGGGEGCITSSNTGIHAGIATLLNDIHVVKKELALDKPTMVIADGGIRNYSDVNKALALGADYVMIGGLFASLIESAAPTYYKTKDGEIQNLDKVKYENITERGGKFFWNTSDGVLNIGAINKTFYGMASRKGQEDLFGKKVHTAEGIEKELKCTTNITKWAENMKDCLTSAMSYCNVTNVNNFNPDFVTVELISNNEKNAINK